MTLDDQPRRYHVEADGVSHLKIYRLACALALSVLFFAYANHFHNAFHFDDDHTIQNNLYIRDLHNIPLFFKNPNTFSSLPANQSYRPLLTTTLAIDYRLGGLDPFVFHVTSFLLFAAQCVALLFLFRRLMDQGRVNPGNRWAALFAATLYGVHTANAETVNYIIARSDILSTLCVVLAVLMFTSTGVARRWHLYLIPAVGGVLAKEQGVMVAPLLFLYVALFERQWALKDLLQPRHIILALKETWPSFVACGAIVAAGIRMAATFTPGGSRWPYLLTQPFVLLHYVFTFLLPFNLSADTDWKAIANPFDDRILVGFIFVGLALWAAVASARRRETRPIAFGILWFFVAVTPTSSVVPFAEVMNDHRVFFPFVGVALAATWAIVLAINARASRADAGGWTKPAIAVAAIALLFAHVFGTRHRNVVWQTEESLWLDVTNKSPQNGRGLMAYGVIQMGKGRLDRADQYFNRALQYTPNYAYLHVNIGVLKGAQGDAAEAERHFLDAQRFDPVNPVSYYYYGRWLDSVGRTEEAIPLARRALELSPNDVLSQELLQSIDARRLARPAATPPGTPETPEQWLDLSLRQYRAAQYEDCIHSSQQALNLRPDYAEALNNICAAANAIGRYGEAVSACERALAIKPDYVLARNNLALAKANQKK